jgi:carbamoyl-phosphate synthase large subunit
MGGQTALNTALTLNKRGVLKKWDVEMIGARAEAIDKAEDRDLFRTAMTKIGLSVPKSAFVNTSDLKQRFEKEYEDGLAAASAQGADAADRFKADWSEHRIPAPRGTPPHRPVAGAGSLQAHRPAGHHPPLVHAGRHRRRHRLQPLGVLRDRHERRRGLAHLGSADRGIRARLERVRDGGVRDKDDNCIIICSIENLDPMGVHTGDSITVAPALTLTDKEYQIMRNASIAVLREIGVETGGSNVQFAVNPEDGRLVVIEMNPRVSRSSALASKATGFPIAKVAARSPSATRSTSSKTTSPAARRQPRSSRPSTTSSPRSRALPSRSSPAPSPDHRHEVGRRGHGHWPHLPESLQKALRGLETGLTGLDEIELPATAKARTRTCHPRRHRRTPTPDRLLKVAQACGSGHERRAGARNLPSIDPWFSPRSRILAMEERIASTACRRTPRTCGCSSRWAFPTRASARSPASAPMRSPRAPDKLGVTRSTSASTPALPSSPRPPPTCTRPTNRPAGSDACNEAHVSDREKVVILGGGPNRIGQGIEFDYCCCHAAFALKDAGYESIMVNCNPETVSTDYDTSDRLYFDR